MNKEQKHLLMSILIGLTSVIYFFLVYKGYKNQNLDLSKFDQYENILIKKGIGIHYGSKGKQSNVFFISIKGLEEDLGIYRISKEYDDLLEKVTIGDNVKVYYKKSSNNEGVNIDLIQVEKDGKVLISKDEYEEKESFLIYIGLIAGFGTLIGACIYYNKGSVFKTRKNYFY